MVVSFYDRDGNSAYLLCRYYYCQIMWTNMPVHSDAPKGGA